MIAKEMKRLVVTAAKFRQRNDFLANEVVIYQQVLARIIHRDVYPDHMTSFVMPGSKKCELLCRISLPARIRVHDPKVVQSACA